MTAQIGNPHLLRVSPLCAQVWGILLISYLLSLVLIHKYTQIGMGNGLEIRVLRRGSKNGALLLADLECSVDPNGRLVMHGVCTHVVYLHSTRKP